MPCIKVKGGWKIRRSKGGLYPKIYSSIRACLIRVRQMEQHKGRKKKIKRKG